jgi:ribosomal protein S18 acetylase RimI-like enzyme
MTALQVRPYQAPDRAGLCRLAADTAFFGEPVEHFLEDRQLFFDVMFAYYIDFEAELAWVAILEQQVAGFIVGSADTATQQHRLWRQIVPRVLLRFVQRHYRIGQQTWRWLGRLGETALRQDIAAADLNLYPAHLHINVDARFRGRGIGRQLMERFLETLRQRGIPGVHLHTTDRNVAACQLYTGLGMQLLAARSTRLWVHVLGAPIESRCYGMRLIDAHLPGALPHQCQPGAQDGA